MEIKQAFKDASDKIEILYEDSHNLFHIVPDMAAGITVTANGAVYTLGNYAVIVPTGLETTRFDFHRINIDNINSNGQYQMNFYSGPDGSEILIGSITFHRTNANNDTADAEISVPIQLPGTQIKAKMASSAGGGTATIHLHVQQHD